MTMSILVIAATTLATRRKVAAQTGLRPDEPGDADEARFARALCAGA
jgi:hypothetical protein